ncbi:hypothetical protein C8R45DRAFT_1081901 [Mycena sanguinolenta]|nr:hypothetical protein C8R45DRAFT_1081901 [Mycena sanguinolenta]
MSRWSTSIGGRGRSQTSMPLTQKHDLQFLENPYFHIDDPPPHLAFTNNAPSESEVAEILRAVDQGRAYIADLQTEIDRLQEAIEAAACARLDAQNKLKHHTAILSPLRRFPAEILGAIFHWTLPPPNSRAAFLAQSPWNLSRVCSLWRTIVLSSPDLWSRISIHSSRTFPIHALQAQLQRSQPRPLTVTFSCEGLNSNMNGLGLLLEHSARWESVSLLRPPRDTILRFNTLNQLHVSLPRLHTLSFKRSDDSETCTAFERAPRLTDVRIDGSHRRLVVPYAQLERLRVQMPRTPDRLSLAHNLVYLTLGKASMTLPPPSYPSPIRLPRLRVLCLADGHYLESLLLPALEDICVKEHVSFLPAFIARSSCRLQKLTVIEETTDIVAILNSAPTLREMRLRHLYAISVLVRHLAVPDDGTPVVCPELGHLTLCDIEEQQFLLALELVDARRKATDVPSLSLCILDLHFGSDGCPYNVPLSVEVEWVSGKRAVESVNDWRPHGTWAENANPRSRRAISGAEAATITIPILKKMRGKGWTRVIIIPWVREMYSQKALNAQHDLNGNGKTVKAGKNLAKGDSAQSPRRQCSNCITLKVECTHIGSKALEESPTPTGKTAQEHVETILSTSVVYLPSNDANASHEILVQVAAYARELEETVVGLRRQLRAFTSTFSDSTSSTRSSTPDSQSCGSPNFPLSEEGHPSPAPAGRRHTTTTMASLPGNTWRVQDVVEMDVPSRSDSEVVSPSTTREPQMQESAYSRARASFPPHTNRVHHPSTYDPFHFKFSYNNALNLPDLHCSGGVTCDPLGSTFIWFKSDWDL